MRSQGKQTGELQKRNKAKTGIMFNKVHFQLGSVFIR